MQLLMAVLADRSDVVDGKANLIGIYQSVVASEFPTVLHGVLAIRVAVEPDAPEWVEVSATLRQEAASARPPQEAGTGRPGTTADEPEMEPSELSVVAFVPPTTAAQPLRGLDVTIDLEGSRLPDPGLYSFDIAVDGRNVASVPLSVLRLAPGGRA